jgi:hypothetical protein
MRTVLLMLLAVATFFFMRHYRQRDAGHSLRKQHIVYIVLDGGTL